MITNLIVRNFEAHKKSTLTFHKGVNAIVGSSDKGKSSLLRALRWVVYNRPLGNSFIRHGAKYAKVLVYVENKLDTFTDHVVRRVKSKSKNYYSVNDIKLKAMNTGVPELVQNTVNLGDLNFQEQHDAPFLLSQSAGAIAKELNAYANLSLIDRTLGALNKRLRSAKNMITHYTAQLHQLRGVALSYPDQRPFLQACERVTLRYREWVHLVDGCTFLSHFIGVFQQVRDDVRKAQTFTGYDRISDVARRNKRLETLQSKVAVLSALIKHLQTGKASQRQKAPDLSALLAGKAQWVETCQRVAALEALYNEAKQADEKCKTYQDLVELNQQKLQELCKGACPTCGQPMKGIL